VIVKAIPDPMMFRTAARARGVRTLSGVTSAPSTSATTRRTSSRASSFSRASSLPAIGHTSQEHNRARERLQKPPLAINNVLARHEFMLSPTLARVQCYICFYSHYGCHKQGGKERSAVLFRMSGWRMNGNVCGQSGLGSAKVGIHRETRWSFRLSEPWLEVF